MSSPTVSAKLRRIAEQARNDPGRVFTTLAHLIDVEFLHEAYRRTRKDAAPGPDGMTAAQYAEHLDENLHDLHQRLRSGRYRAPPAQRVWLDKDDGSQRPIAIPAFEDKIAQRAVAMILGAVYEQDFLDISHGFREGYSPHQALAALREQCRQMGGTWIVDADVAEFFDNLDWGWLRDILKQRVNDGGILRLIGKWLHAGVLDGQSLQHPDKGTPQGGVISPMLSNIFLHHVLDTWFVSEVQPRLRGRSFLVRFADDFVIGCQREDDARKVMAVLPKRFGRFKLTIHPTKTTLVRFRKPASGTKVDRENGSFDFLGFTHFWDRSRRGYWVIKRKTAKKRLRRTMTSLWRWCRDHRHWKLPEQHQALSQKLRGHYQYFGIRSNYKMLEVVYEHAEKAWRHWLGRRSSKRVTWKRFDRIREVFPLPQPRIIHAI